MSVISNSVMSFLKNDMCFDLEYLICKINSLDDLYHQELVFKMINESLMGCFLDEKSILSVFNNVVVNISEDSDVYDVIESLRHAFISFDRGGIRDLYKYQENQSWYPRLIVDRIIYPNDINVLDDEIVIYRGCSVVEYNNNDYGQSWTTSQVVAEKFAYEVYINESWFCEEDRLIVTALCNKDFLLYSDQAMHSEYEVVLRKDAISSLNVAVLKYERT